MYQECLEIEFELQGLSFESQAQLSLAYKGKQLKKKYIPDFALLNKVILEIKAVKEVTDEHRAQVYNYLRATGYRLGLLVNFGHHPGVQYERIVI